MKEVCPLVLFDRDGETFVAELSEGPVRTIEDAREAVSRCKELGYENIRVVDLFNQKHVIWRPE